MKTFFLTFLLLKFGSSEFQDDLEKIKNQYSCDPYCTFNHSEITSKTVTFFPKCEEICGILIFNQNTDLSESQLSEVFENMHTLFGGIDIQSSSLKSLSFIKTYDNVYRKFNFFCETYGFFIKNNLLLTDISILNNVYMWGDQNYEQCEFRIENNTNLDTKFLEQNMDTYRYLDVRTSGNLKNCGCRGDDITSNVPESYSTCEYLFGGLNFSSGVDVSDLEYLGKIKNVMGHFIIQNTDLEDLSFLKSLETIHMKNIGIKDEVFLAIQNNSNMRKLGLDKFKELQYDWGNNRFVNFENLHPDFCITISEMKIFFQYNVFFKNIHAKYCDDVGFMPIYRVCKFENKLSNLEDYCSYILGDLKIGDGDEEHVQKLSMVSMIFGSLRIENTSFSDLSFLSALRYIGSLDGKAI